MRQINYFENYHRVLAVHLVYNRIEQRLLIQLSAAKSAALLLNYRAS